jgi:phasin family protein
MTAAKGGSHGGKENFDLKFPSFPDMTAVLEGYRRNIEVLTRANQVAWEGAQLFARRQAEIIQENMAELSEALSTIAFAGSAEQRAAKQAEWVKRAYERAVNNARELGEILQRSSGEALDILNRRFMEAMEEMQGHASKHREGG